MSTIQLPVDGGNVRRSDAYEVEVGVGPDGSFIPTARDAQGNTIISSGPGPTVAPDATSLVRSPVYKVTAGVDPNGNSVLMRCDATGRPMVAFPPGTVLPVVGTAPGTVAAGDDPQIRNASRDYTDENSSAFSSRIAGKTAGGGTINIFSAGNLTAGTGYARNTSLWCADVDLTCFSPWNSTGNNQQGGCLITSRHVALANHFSGPGGSDPMTAGTTTMKFVDNASVIYTRIVAALTRVGSTDVLIATLDSDLPAAITPARLLPSVLGSFAPNGILIGAPLLSTNAAKQARIVLGISAPTDAATAYAWSVQSATAGPYASWSAAPPIIVGDSGSPVFAVFDGRVCLAFLHHRVTGNQAIGDGVGEQLAGINAILGSGYALTVAPFNRTFDPGAARQGGNVDFAVTSFEFDSQILGVPPGGEDAPAVVAYSVMVLDNNGSPSFLTLAAGQSIRRTADGSGFESYSPSTGDGTFPFTGIPYSPSTGGTVRALADGTAYAHTFATGAGTEASPYTSTDGTGGMNGAVASLTRGGRVVMAAGSFALTSPATVTVPATCIFGLATGANIDPNGENEGITGSKLRCSGDGVRLGRGDSTRLGGVRVESLYLWGAGLAGAVGNYFGSSAINFVGPLDQPVLRDLNIGNFSKAIDLTSNSTFVDTAWIDHVNALHCGFGVVCAATSFYCHILDSCFADSDNQAILLTSLDNRWTTISRVMAVRVARLHNDASDCAIYLAGDGHVVSECVVEDTGHNLLTDTYQSAADGIVLLCNNTTVSANQIRLNTVGSGVRVKSGASKNILRGNAYVGNLVDITVEAGATDTVIEESQQGLNIVDNGTRTIINGVSVNAGDPNATGDWNGVSKPVGLIIRDTTNSVTYLYLPGGSRVTL